MATFDATSPVRGWGCVCRAAMRSRSHVESSRPGCYDCMSADNPVCVKVAAEGIRGMLCWGSQVDNMKRLARMRRGVAGNRCAA
jgi:hypothetical protein